MNLQSRWCACLIALLLARPALAEEQVTPPPPPAHEQPPQAGAGDFEHGMELYRNGDCKDAVGPLESSMRASPRPSALLALGFCYRQMRKFARATDAYQRYLQLHFEDEKRALFLLEETLQEERDWRRENPSEAEAADAGAAPAQPPPSPAPGSGVPAQPAPGSPPAATDAWAMLPGLESLTPEAREQYFEQYLSVGSQLNLYASGSQLVTFVTHSVYQGRYHRVLKPAEFFHLVSKPALATSYDKRVAGKWTLGAAGVALGVGGLIYAATGLHGCSDTTSNPNFAQDCVYSNDASSVLLVTALLEVAAGGMVLGAVLIDPMPVEVDEVRRLADRYNHELLQKLAGGRAPPARQEAVPIQASFAPVVLPRGAGLALALHF